MLRSNSAEIIPDSDVKPSSSPRALKVPLLSLTLKGTTYSHLSYHSQVPLYNPALNPQLRKHFLVLLHTMLIACPISSILPSSVVVIITVPQPSPPHPHHPRRNKRQNPTFTVSISTGAE
jgi:hypothetical protein